MTKRELLISCEMCGAVADCEHHLIFGRGMRALAEADWIKIPICNKCHNLGKLEERIHENPPAEKLSKKLGQMLWERNYIAEAYEMATGESIKKEARREFMNRYGRSFIDGL